MEKRKAEKRQATLMFIMLLVLYAIAYVFTLLASRSTGVIQLKENRLPLSSFAGVFSSLANMLLIFIVVIFKKRGYYTSLAIMLAQIPILIVGILVRQNLSSIPGLFGSIFTIVVMTLIYRRSKQIDYFQTIEINYLKQQQKLSQRLFEQTATALVNAIDAKDAYSHGHSMRVAEYSEKIARAMGKSDEECYKIYYTALLHDVGKIGISDAIINKKGKLTDEEYEAIKQHPVLGNQILSSISEYPYLSIGAHFHHERYDGKGYPDKLKGEDIPEIARIIAVADAYDAMTSTRSYRDAIPQQLVREEIVKNAGTQFDPEVANIMQHIIDLDTEYQMKERTTVQELSGKSELHCDAYRSEISEGILVIPAMTRIEMDYYSENEEFGRGDAPTIILFDSLDGRVHKDEIAMRELNYFEFGEIRFDGKTECKGARKMKTNVIKKSSSGDAKSHVLPMSMNGKKYKVDAVRIKDHALIRIDDGKKTVEITIALPDNTRYTYIGLTGENCHITNVSINKEKEFKPLDYIARIAEPVNFIKGPEGDVPNVQIDGFRMASTAGIPITDGLTIKFHTESLPTARLIWHCPYVVLFNSEDGKINGGDYREYALIRLDGENWHGENLAENKLIVTKTEDFHNWDDWKKTNKEGFDVTVHFERKGDTITVTTENLGIFVKNITTVLDGKEAIYVALTGDQVALTNIRIENP
ncbi:MAG: HD-GYP domain-containing protein [Clostridiales bacterium]|nr:HD-GYP domain-containing protein [Clostridiales bacterium]